MRSNRTQSIVLLTALTRLRKCILWPFRVCVANEYKLPIKIIFTLRKLNIQVLAINFFRF